MLINIDYIPIQIFEISIPPLDLELKSDAFVKLRQADADSLRGEIGAYFDSIAERIQKFSYDILAVNKIQAAKEIMNELSKKCSIERKFLLQLLQQTCLSTLPSDLIAINNVKRVFKEKLAAWDTEFDVFVRNFVHPEARDLRKITSVQLKKIFDIGKPSELEGIQTISENYLPLLGSSPNGGSLPNADYASFHLSSHRKLSVEIMASLHKLGNQIHLPIFGSSPTNSIILPQFFNEGVEKSRSYVSQFKFYESDEGILLFNMKNIRHTKRRL
jgi:hypothetical protein